MCSLVSHQDFNEGGKKDSIKHVTTLCADLDYGSEGHKTESKSETREEALQAIDSFLIQPSIVVDSGNGFHIYWLLVETYELESPDYVESIQKAIIAQMGCDPGTQDITRILRLPETNNLKNPENPKPVKVVRFNPEKRYNLEEFARLLPEIKKEKATRKKEHSSDYEYEKIDRIIEGKLLKKAPQIYSLIKRWCGRFARL